MYEEVFKESTGCCSGSLVPGRDGLSIPTEMVGDDQYILIATL